MVRRWWQKIAGDRGLSARPPSDEEWSAPPPVPDPEAAVLKAVRAFESDPDGAIAGLEKLRRAHAPDALLLHSLCLLYHRAGRTESAIEVGREAIPLCFRRGRGLLVAQLLEVLEADAAALGLSRDELLALGGALSHTTYWSLGFRALASLVLADPRDEDAVRALLRLADYLGGEARLPAEAFKVVQFLAALCAGSAEFDAIERRLCDLERDHGAVVPAEGSGRFALR